MVANFFISNFLIILAILNFKYSFMKKVLCSLAVGFAALSFGQINKSQGFEVDNGDFANASFFRSKTTPVCEGSYGLIRNF